MPVPSNPCGRASRQLVLTCALSCALVGAGLIPARAASAQDSSTPAAAEQPRRAAGPPDGMIPPPPVTPAPAPILLPPSDNRPPPPADVRSEPAPSRQTGPDRAEAPSREERAASSPQPSTAPSRETPASPTDTIPPPVMASDGNAADEGTPTALPDESATPEAVAAPAWYGWWPALVAALLTLTGAAWFMRRRKRPAPLDLPAPDAITPRPAPADAGPPARPRAPIGQRAEISLRLEPLSASSTLVNFRMRYAVIVTNSGSCDAVDCALRIGLFAGTQASERGVQQWLMLDGQAPHHHAPIIAAGGEIRFDGELAAPLDALGAIDLNGRKMAITLVALDLRYHHPPGAAVLDGQTARAFVVGREPGDGAQRLAPFRIDQGPASFAPLGVRDTRIGIVS